jgi:hypothetical protein
MLFMALESSETGILGVSAQAARRAAGLVPAERWLISREPIT